MHPLAEKVIARDLRATARACRLVDDRVGEYRQILVDLYPHTGRAWILGVTGNPGAGKSTLTDRLIAAFRARKERVAVVAIDPTSPFSGGAILGDRIRMQAHASDPEVFIRSVATRGALGGLSRSAMDIVRILDAWGADVVIVETVGVGQDELEITRSADTTLIVMAPGLGDDVQAIKAGLLECADAFAVNKADRDGADGTVRDLELMIALGGEVVRAGVHTRGHTAGTLDVAKQVVRHDKDKWVPAVMRTVAATIAIAMAIVGMLVGGLWILAAGLLRHGRGVNETIASLLLTYIAVALLNHLVEGPLRDPASLNKPSTSHIGDANMLGSLPGMDVHWGLAFGVLFCLGAYVLMRHTTFGFAVDMVGGNV
ncbi:MAG TPA: methylmalonyl Co-A mutase-associated GTPase MeaB, partial [Polyangium sp.]|nr:methylmalonyl Co-A mutase-associated GTPase MeaB [Polyangium sp.]